MPLGLSLKLRERPGGGRAGCEVQLSRGKMYGYCRALFSMTERAIDSDFPRA